MDIPGYTEEPEVSKSNVVVDTIRLISGIPQSRLATIMEEEEEEEEEMEERRFHSSFSQSLSHSMSGEAEPLVV